MPRDEEPASGTTPSPEPSYQADGLIDKGLTDINSLFRRHAQSFYASSLEQTRRLMNYQADGHPSKERRRGACRRQRVEAYDGPER